MRSRDIKIHSWEPAYFEAVKQITGYSRAQIVHPSRSREKMYAAHMTTHILKIAWTLPICTIATMLNRDHSTILHRCRTSEDLLHLNTEADYQNDFRKLLKCVDDIKCTELANNINYHIDEIKSIAETLPHPITISLGNIGQGYTRSNHSKLVKELK